MEDELRLSLLIIGTFIIVGVLAHGMWKIRKNNQSERRRERVEPGNWDDSQWQDDSTDDPLFDERGGQEDYDELGVGKVRVVSERRQPESSASASSESTADHKTAAPADALTTSSTTEKPVAEKLYGSVVSNPKPHMQSSASTGTASDEQCDENIPAPPGFLLKESDDKAKAATSTEAATPVSQTPEFADAAHKAEPDMEAFELDSQQPQADQAESNQHKIRRHSSPRQRQEPNFGDDQMRIDFDEPKAAVAKADGQTDEPASKAETQPAQQEVLILNVRAADNKAISGAALLPLLLTLGFKFGDQDIFHRHVNSNGKGPVLFSLANMFKPGSFDIDNLEVFSTQGVSLFMILPIEGDAHQVFNMMHNAARKIADEFDAQILDGRRSVLTKQGLQQYIEKIREFERRRMVARH